MLLKLIFLEKRHIDKLVIYWALKLPITTKILRETLNAKNCIFFSKYHLNHSGPIGPIDR